MSKPYREFHDNDKVGSACVRLPRRCVPRNDRVGSACTGAPGRRALRGGRGVPARDCTRKGYIAVALRRKEKI